MKSKLSRREFSATGIALGLPSVLQVQSSLSAETFTPTIRIIVGPSKHPPGTHEVAATGRLIQFCLDQAIQKLGVVSLRVQIHERWPEDQGELDATQCCVFVGDFFPPMRMEPKDRIMADLSSMMARGVGIVCIHYATGLGAQDVADDGSHPLLEWMGGYFATRCKHHQSVARVFETCTIQPTAITHPILNGWKPFTFHDEPYFNNYFGPNGPASNVAILATSELPLEAPKTEAVSWAIERADSGRGVGIVMPHFIKNWLQADLRKMVLNAIMWSAKQSIPESGVEVTLDDIAQFKPDSVEPIAKAKAK
jgi:type 1 glutamine amidotransferase